MKHAILILGATNLENLEHVVNLLDDPQIDFFLHWDKSSKLDLTPETNKSYFKRINLVPRVNVAWGGSSMLEAEIQLFKTANALHKYNYYHLISDTDLPLMNKAYFLQFFLDAQQQNFIGLTNHGQTSVQDVERIRYYYPFMNFNIERIKKIKLAGLGKKIQRSLHISRPNLDDFVISKGAQWGSYTGAFIEHVLDDETKRIRKSLFTWSDRSDELFLQVVAMNSAFKNTIDVTLDENTMATRYIDWQRGTPFTFDDRDLAEIQKVHNTNYAFGRKFGHVPMIVAYLYEHK